MKQIWDPIDSMMNETPFNVYQHKNMKTLLAEAQQKLGTVPRLVLDYDIFQVYKTQLTNVKKFNDILSELRGEAVKKQHWGQLLSVLKSPYRTDNMSQMTVWHFWELDLLALKSKVQGILDRARGQYQLEEQLSKSKELWGEMVLDLAKYKSKCKLIRGWDDLRMALDDDIKMLASMRMSQFFKDF
jgi:dynein heavy chain 1